MSKKKKDNDGPSIEAEMMKMMTRRLMEAMGPERRETGYIDEVFTKMRNFRARWSQDFTSQTHICEDDCPLRMGVSVSVCDREKIKGTIPDRSLDAVLNSVILCSVEEHSREHSIIILDVETAKKVVNAIGTAITLIEQEAGVTQ